MEFVGDTGISANIPVPNLNLTPEMLSRNCPLEFLLQPIIPLLSTPISDEPSFSIYIPGLAHVYDAIYKVFDGPTVQVVGATIAATGVAYCAWKLSVKWNEGMFGNKAVDPDTTERLDDEVARIMSVMKPEENTVTSACSSLMCQSKGDLTSNTSFFMERMSQDSLCLCAEGCGPIRQLHSRIDQVMSKMEDMISGLKALDVHKKDSTSNTQEDAKNTAMLEIAVEEVKTAKKQMESNHQLFPPGIKDGDIAKKAEDIQEGIRKLEAASEKLEKALECGHMKPLGVRTIHNDSQHEAQKKESSYHPSPANLRFINIVPFDKTRTTSDTYRPFPLRNMKRNIHSRNINVKPFPVMDGHSSSGCTDIQEGKTNVPCAKDEPVDKANDVITSTQQSVPLEIKYGFVNVRDTKSGDSGSLQWTGGSRHVKDVAELKRHETWPMISNGKENSISPKQQSGTLPHALSFKHSDNSDFQKLEQFKLSISSAKCRSKQAKDLEDISPRSQHFISSCKLKTHNSPRTKHHLSFKNKSSPAKSAKAAILKPLDRLPEEPEPDSLQEVSEGNNSPDMKYLEEVLTDSKLVNKHAHCKGEIFQGGQATFVDEPVKFNFEPSSSIMNPQGNLFEQEGTNVLPKNVSCHDQSQVVNQPTSACAVLNCSNPDNDDTHMVTNDLAGGVQLTNDVDQEQWSTTTTLDQTIRFLTSPFKRHYKNKTSDFHVKYVVSKHSNPGPGNNIYVCNQQAESNITATTTNNSEMS